MMQLEICPKCNGEGGWFEQVKSCTDHGSSDADWVKCVTCKGTGKSEAPVVLSEADATVAAVANLRVKDGEDYPNG